MVLVCLTRLAQILGPAPTCDPTDSAQYITIVTHTCSVILQFLEIEQVAFKPGTKSSRTQLLQPADDRPY